MESQAFADGVAAIAVIGPTIRIDFFTLSGTERDANGQPKPEVSHRVVMGLDGFLRANTKLQEVAEEIVRRNPSLREQKVQEFPPATNAANAGRQPSDQNATAKFP